MGTIGSRSKSLVAGLLLLAQAAFGMSLGPLMDEIYAIRDRSRADYIPIHEAVRRHIPPGSSGSTVREELVALGFKCYTRTRPQDVRELQELGYDSAFDCDKNVTKWYRFFADQRVQINIFLKAGVIVITGGDIVLTTL